MLCNEKKEYLISSRFKLCCDKYDTIYTLIIEDEKQIHTAIVECKCGNRIKI